MKYRNQPLLPRKRLRSLDDDVSASHKILLKKSICQSVAKFLSNPLTLFGILIQVPAAQDAIVAVQRNKIKRADFFNRIDNIADIGERN